MCIRDRTVSSLLHGEYGQENVYVGVPCIVNRNGVRSVIELPLNDAEMVKFNESCEKLRGFYSGIKLR